jgi:hypothetical protein
MALRNRIATAAVTLTAVAFAVPVASASAATTPLSAYAGGQVGTQNGIGGSLQAAADAWKVGAQAGMNGWTTGLLAAQGGISTGVNAGQAAFGLGAQALGIPFNGSVGVGLPLSIGIG